MQGIIACETLYAEIESRVADAEVRYLPHELHEFPVNVGDDRRIHESLRREIAALDRADVSQIVVLYTGIEDLSGIATEQAPLVVSSTDDCISTFRYRERTDETGEVKDPGVYYLSRGSIDRAVDSFKLFAGFRGDTASLLDRFEAAAVEHPDMQVDWNEGAFYDRAVDRWSGMTPETVERLFADLLSYYDTVELLDNDNLYEVHRWYGTAFRDFLEDLAGARGDDQSVEFRIAEADDGLLDSLLADSPASSSAHVSIFEPGETVPESVSGRSDCEITGC